MKMTKGWSETIHSSSWLNNHWAIEQVQSDQPGSKEVRNQPPQSNQLAISKSIQSEPVQKVLVLLLQTMSMNSITLTRMRRMTSAKTQFWSCHKFTKSKISLWIELIKIQIKHKHHKYYQIRRLSRLQGSEKNHKFLTYLKQNFQSYSVPKGETDLKCEVIRNLPKQNLPNMKIRRLWASPKALDMLNKVGSNRRPYRDLWKAAGL